MADTRTLTLKFNGREVTAAPLVSGQIGVFQLTTGRETEDQQKRAAHRMMRVLESSLGEDQWEDIKDDMADGSVTMSDFYALTTELIELSAKALNAPKVPDVVQARMDLSVVDSDPEIQAAQATLHALMERRGKLDGGE